MGENYFYLLDQPVCFSEIALSIFNDFFMQLSHGKYQIVRIRESELQKNKKDSSS